MKKNLEVQLSVKLILYLSGGENKIGDRNLRLSSTRYSVWNNLVCAGRKRRAAKGDKKGKSTESLRVVVD